MYIYVCIYICMYVHIYIYIYIYLYIHLYVFGYIDIHTYTYTLLYIYYARPNLLRFEHSVFLEPTFFFHINALRGEANPQFLNIL